MNRKLVIMMLTALVAASAFAGCSSGKEETAEATETATPTPTETATPTPTETPTPTPTEKVEITKYTLVETPLLKEKSVQAEVLTTLAINTAVTVVEDAPDFCKVRVDNQEGYVTAVNLTENQAEAEAAQAEAAQAQAEAEAQAAAEAQSKAEEEAMAAQEEAQAAIDALNENQAVIEEVENPEVSLTPERIPDCDGSGHGVIRYKYPDGSYAMNSDGTYVEDPY